MNGLAPPYPTIITIISRVRFRQLKRYLYVFNPTDLTSHYDIFRRRKPLLK